MVKVESSIIDKIRESLHLVRNYFSCEEKLLLRRKQIFIKNTTMNMEIATNFEVVKLGQHVVNL